VAKRVDGRNDRFIRQSLSDNLDEHGLQTQSQSGMNRFLCWYIYTVDHCSHVRIYFAMDIDSDGLRVIEMLD
jgi:hypothetical protein